MQKVLPFFSLIVVFAAVLWAGEITVSAKQYKDKYFAHTHAMQWVCYLNYLRRKYPNTSLDELVGKEPPPFLVPKEAVFFVLSQKEKTGIFEDCDFGVEIDSAGPFVIYNNGLTFYSQRK